MVAAHRDRVEVVRRVSVETVKDFPASGLPDRQAAVQDFRRLTRAASPNRYAHHMGIVNSRRSRSRTTRNLTESFGLW